VHRRSLSSLLVSLVAATPAAAQELPPDAVARVGAETVTRADFDSWFGPTARSMTVDPPRFRRCTAALRKRAAEDEAARPRRRDLRERCGRRAVAVRKGVMQFLIQGLWVRQEAEARGIEVTLRQVVRRFEEQKRVAFESERDYRHFLRQSGLTETQILYRVALALLQERLAIDVTDAVSPVTRAEAERHIARRRSKYRGVPRKRALRAARRHLRAIRQQRALARFTVDFRGRYRAITVCADGYVVGECGQRA
jgi:hypothetical protein